MSADQLGEQLLRDRAGGSGLRLGQAVVVGVGVATVDLLLEGADADTPTPGVPFLESYVLPQIGDMVWTTKNGPDRLVLGRQSLSTRPAPVVVEELANSALSDAPTNQLFTSLQFAAEGEVRYKATLAWSGILGNTVGDVLRQSLTDPADPTLTPKAAVYQRVDVGGSVVHNGGSYSVRWTPPAGLRTVSWMFQRSGGSGSVGIYGPGTSFSVERFDP